MRQMTDGEREIWNEMQRDALPDMSEMCPCDEQDDMTDDQFDYCEDYCKEEGR